MKTIKTLLLASCSLFVSTTTFANNYPSCPSIAEIQANPVVNVTPLKGPTWVVSSIQPVGVWSPVEITVNHFTDKQAAIEAAQAAQKNIVKSNPVLVLPDKLECIYQTTTAYNQDGVYVNYFPPTKNKL